MEVFMKLIRMKKLLLFCAVTCIGLHMSNRCSAASPAYTSVESDVKGILDQIGAVEVEHVLKSSTAFNDSPDNNNKNNVVDIWTKLTRLHGTHPYLANVVAPVLLVKTCAYFIHMYLTETFTAAKLQGGTTTKEAQTRTLKDYIIKGVAKLCRVTELCTDATEFTCNGFKFTLGDIRLDDLCTMVAEKLAFSFNFALSACKAFETAQLHYEDLKTIMVTMPDHTTKSLADYVQLAIENIDDEVAGHITAIINAAKEEASKVMAAAAETHVANPATGAIRWLKDTFWTICGYKAARSTVQLSGLSTVVAAR